LLSVRTRIALEAQATTIAAGTKNCTKNSPKSQDPRMLGRTSLRSERTRGTIPNGTSFLRNFHGLFHRIAPPQDSYMMRQRSHSSVRFVAGHATAWMGEFADPFPQRARYST